MDHDEVASVEGTQASSEAGSSESETELMITTRERRKTAGNRYSQVVAQEQADDDVEDDVALLFAEADGEDEEYNSDEADDEAEMSSSDDDDQGPNAAPDDLEGEQEVQKQAKLERQKKRKADMALTTMSAIRKKPKIDPTSLHRAPDRPKPSKRKERVSWLPDSTAAPGRTSSRKQTVAHREVLLERLKENEEQRLKNKAQREEKEKRKKAEAPKQMTQADRLAEAERNERRNAKSLNRWETMEKQRAEEQAAKLAALKNRKLNGAVLTFVSSSHVYRGPKADPLNPAINGSDDQQVKKRGRKSKAFHEQQAMLLQANIGNNIQSQQTTVDAEPGKSTLTPVAAISTPKEIDGGSKNGTLLVGIHEYASTQKAPGDTSTLNTQDNTSKAEKVQQTPIEEQLLGHASDTGGKQSEDQSSGHNLIPATSLVSDVSQQGSQKTKNIDMQLLPTNPATPETPNSAQDTFSKAKDNVKIPPAGESTLPIGDEQSIDKSNTEAPAQPENESATLSNAQPIEQQTEQPTAQLMEQSTAQPIGNHDEQLTAQPALQDNAGVAAPQPAIIEVTSTRNLVVLDSFEDLSAAAKQAYSVFYGTKKAPKPAKYSGELCAITGFQAKYRDPKTGAAYANANAYRKLKELQKHGYQWSGMLGCFVGKTTHVARGVPEGFLAS